MKCPINGKPCSKYKGFHITEKVGDDIKTYTVCEDCLYAHASKMENKSKECSKCGSTIETIVRSGRVGCFNCYTDLEDSISRLISSVQNGNTKHIGCPPESWKIRESEETNPIKFATELAYKMRNASKYEQYEKAAFIKNKLDKFSFLLSQLQNTNEERLPKIKKTIAEFIYQYRKEEESI